MSRREERRTAARAAPAAGIQRDLRRMLDEFSADPELAETVQDIFELNARKLLGR